MADAESQLYRDLMRLRPDGWTANAWAVRAGVSRTVWTDMRRHGNPSRRTLEKLLTAAGSSLAEFEALRVDPGQAGGHAHQHSAVSDRPPGAWPGAALPVLPRIASSADGIWSDGGVEAAVTLLNAGTIEARLLRPASLAADPRAFAFTVVTDAMWPRFRIGRTVAVSPGATPSPGDDVLVTLATDPNGRSTALMTELVETGPSDLLLRQFNPGATFRIDAADYVAVHKIVGELI